MRPYNVKLSLPTSVHPGVLDTIILRLFTTVCDLFVSPFAAYIVFELHVLESDFFIFPRVRQDGITLPFGIMKVLQFQGVGVDEPHCGTVR